MPDKNHVIATCCTSSYCVRTSSRQSDAVWIASGVRKAETAQRVWRSALNSLNHLLRPRELTRVHEYISISVPGPLVSGRVEGPVKAQVTLHHSHSDHSQKLHLRPQNQQRETTRSKTSFSPYWSLKASSFSNSVL